MSESQVRKPGELFGERLAREFAEANASTNGLEPHKEDQEEGDPLSDYFPAIHEFDPNASKQPPFIRAPGDGRLISDFARELGQLLRDQNFFNYDGNCSRIEFDPKLSVHTICGINPQQFRSLIEQYCRIVATKIVERDGLKESFQVKRSITIDVARATLASDDFISLLRPLYSLNTVRLPIGRKTSRIELLPKGYDLESRIFTVDSEQNFGTEWSLEYAAEYLRELLSEFCFKPDDRERSISVTVACMLTLFCTYILHQGITRPAFIFTANAEGSGKTLLAKLGIIPRLGYCPVGSVPKEETEIRKLIFATALNGSPVLFLDNVSGYLKSPSLEALITGSTITDRVLNESKIKHVPNNLSVIITGNSLSISPDLARRSLLVELFLEQARSEDRVIQNPLDDVRIADRRHEILKALFSLVHAWDKAGQPRPKTTHPAFFACSEIIGGILENAGFLSPFTAPILKNSGDQDFRDMQKLVETMNPGNEFRFSELADYASEYGFFENLIPEANDKSDIAAAKRLKLSNLWKKFAGRLFPEGQRFTIKGETQKTRRYLVEDQK